MSSTPDTIVLIHGLWMTPRSWEKWAERYRSRGYTVLAPAWPGVDATRSHSNRRQGALALSSSTEAVI
jgi:alpha-beta hydrolase superfamily lysophospholipase